MSKLRLGYYKEDKQIVTWQKHTKKKNLRNEEVTTFVKAAMAKILTLILVQVNSYSDS